MTLRINILIILALLSAISFAGEITYKEDGKYRIVSNKHLINDVAYKKGDIYQILVEIPTGSRQKWEVAHKSGQLEWEFRNAKPREVKFLGYPGNYGFIPQTLSGDGDALDIIVLSESAKRGDILKVKVIGMLKLEDTGEEDTKILAIADDSPFKDVETIQDMLMKYPNVIPIVKEWFEGYKGPGKMLFQGYGSAAQAINHIEESHQKWTKHKF